MTREEKIKKQIVDSKETKEIIISSILIELVNRDALRTKLIIDSCEFHKKIRWCDSYVEGEKFYVPFNIKLKSIMTRYNFYQPVKEVYQRDIIDSYEPYYLLNPNINYSKGPKKGGHLLKDDSIIISEQSIQFWYEIELSKLYFDIEYDLLSL